MTYEQFDRIEAFLQGTLSEAEKRAFEQTLAVDETLRSEVEMQRNLRVGLRAVAIGKQVLEARNRSPAHAKPTIVKKLGTNWQSWKWAASLILMLGAGWLAWQANRPMADAQLKGLAEQEMSDVRYKSMPFDSLEIITRKADSAATRQKAEWYLALAYSYKGRKKEAKALLEKIAGNDKHDYQQKAKKLLEEGFK